MESLARQNHPCDFNCFKCKYGDCIRGSAEIIAHEAEVSGRVIQTRRVYKKREIGEKYGPAWMRNIRTLRKAHGISMRDFADKVGVSYQTIQAWESGRKYPTRENLEKLKEVVDALC